MSELVSVVIPIYKVENYINKCIESVCNQTYRNLEIILVDDGSPDRCPKICDEYAKKDLRIKVIHKKNGGLSDARNAGINVAKGAYLFFLDSDDYIDREIIEVLYRNLIKEKADISITGMIRVHDDNGICDMKNSLTRVFNSREAINELFSDLATVMTSAWCKLYKRELFDSIRYPYGRIHEDEFTTYKLYIEANKIVYTENQMYFYRQRETSIIGSRFGKKNLAILDAYEERLRYLENRYPDVIHTAFTHYLNRFLICYERIRTSNEDDKIVTLDSLKKRFLTSYKKYKNKTETRLLDRLKWWSFAHCILLYRLMRLLKKV